MKKLLITLLTIIAAETAHATASFDTTIALDFDTFVIPHPDAAKNIFSHFMGLETDRLLLRKLTPEDADAMLILASDPTVTKYAAALELIKTFDDAKKLVHIMINRYEQDLPARWAIVYKPENKVIGICGFVGYNAASCRAEIGYALHHNYWGKGIATEAAQALINFGFTYMHLNRIEATCDPENIGSIRVIEKLGMIYEATLRQQIWSKGKFRDRKMFALLKEDWLSLNRNGFC